MHSVITKIGLFYVTLFEITFNDKIFNYIYKSYKCLLVTISKYDFILYLFYYIELHYTILNTFVSIVLQHVRFIFRSEMGKLQLNDRKIKSMCYQSIGLLLKVL